MVALASVYATLDRLVERGFAVSELGEPTAERGGREESSASPAKASARFARPSVAHEALEESAAARLKGFA